MNKAACSAIIVSLLLAACQPGPAAGSNGATDAAGSAAASPAPANAASAPQTSASPPPLPTPLPSPSPAAPVTAYKINKNYDFVPIDPNGNKKVVLLTFDDSPKDKKTIESLLDSLDKHEAKAIFFVNGYRAKQNPELLKLLHERGQIIGNHSWDHIDLKKESDEKIDKQISDVQQIVSELTGSAPRFFRPPFGSSNEHVKEAVKKSGMLFMTWSNGSLDWDAKTSDKADEVIQNVMKQLHPGCNILMHELPWTAEALDKMLTLLEEKGYAFLDPRTIEIP